MVQRIAVGLAALAAAGIATLAIPAVAHAATGVLNIRGQTYNDPSGCYNAELEGGQLGPVALNNSTDRPVEIYDGLNCEGDIVGVVLPGENGVSDFGQSVYVP